MRQPRQMLTEKITVSTLVSALLSRWTSLSFSTAPLAGSRAPPAGAWPVRPAVGRRSVMGGRRRAGPAGARRGGGLCGCAPVVSGGGRVPPPGRRRVTLGGRTRMWGRRVVAGRGGGALPTWQGGRPAVANDGVSLVGTMFCIFWLYIMRRHHYQNPQSLMKAHLWGGDASAAVLWDKALGDVDFFLDTGEVPLEGEDTLPERSSDVTDRLALWELSDRSLQTKHIQMTVT